MVAKRVPVTTTRTVARCIPYQIPYEECVLVPQTVCPTPNCPVGTNNLGGSIVSPGLGNSLLPVDNYPTFMVPKPDPASSDPGNGYEDDRPESDNPDGPVLPSAKVAVRKR